MQRADRWWCLPMLVAAITFSPLGNAGAAWADDEAEIKVKHPERFTTVKEWDLTATWSAGGDWSQANDQSKLNTTAKMSFRGQATTLLSVDPDQGGWTTKEDGRPSWSASLTGEKKITNPNIKGFEWKWETKPDQGREHPPGAGLLIDLQNGTYTLAGSLYFTEVKTRLDSPTPEVEEHLDSVTLRSDDPRTGEPRRLPESGNELSGSVTRYESLGPFCDLNPQDFTEPPEISGVIPYAEVTLNWTLRPHAADTRFEYGPSASNIEALKYDNLVVGHEVGLVRGSDLWSLHSNWEGQVYVEGKAKLKIDKSARRGQAGKKRVSGRYPIRRLARSWKLDDKGNFFLQPEPSGVALPDNWIYDSRGREEDWLDLASMPLFSQWVHGGQLDEFLVGVVDDDPVVRGAPANEIQGADDALKAAKDHPQDKYFERISGLPEFKYLYVAYLIETCPFPGHPRVFRITYFSEGPFDLAQYKAKYQAPVPTMQYPWGGTTGWKEVVKKGKDWKVADFTAAK